MFAEDQYAIRCLRAGAHGYLNKAGDPAQLIVAVRALAQGRKYVSPEVAQMLVESLSNPMQELPHTTLSERELQTVLKIASGKRLSEIAEEMTLSPKTVSVYRARALEKASVTSSLTGQYCGMPRRFASRKRRATRFSEAMLVYQSCGFEIARIDAQPSRNSRTRWRCATGMRRPPR